MSTYPYPDSEEFPQDAQSLEYQLNWNDRFDSGEPVRSYRFDYRQLPSTPATICVGADSACVAKTAVQP